MVMARNNSIPVNVKEEFTSPEENAQVFRSTGGPYLPLAWCAS